MFLIENFIDEASCHDLRKKIFAIAFVSGEYSAGEMASRVKSNLEIDQNKGKNILDDLRFRIMSDKRINRLVFPKNIAHLIINRHDPEMGFGNHLDNPIIDGVRTDIAFTIFLEDRANYEGGALVIEQPHGALPKVVKPKIGSIFLYPSCFIHRVEKVTKGSRLACVGWIQSRIRDEQQREVIRDLSTIATEYHEKNGYDNIFNLLVKNRYVLMRMWSD
jgi:PKHD-type hydroxylase